MSFPKMDFLRDQITSANCFGNEELIEAEK